ERFAVEVLHDHVAIAALECAEIEHLENVIAADLTGCLRLSLEPFDRLDVVRTSRDQDFDRDAPANEDVLAFVHLAHPALSEQSTDSILVVDDLALLE